MSPVGLQTLIDTPNCVLEDRVRIYILFCKHPVYIGCLQKNVAVSKINKKFISHLTRAKRSPSAAANVQVFYALIIILQCMHPGSHDAHPHDNRICPI
jgi:ribosomal protein L31